MINYHGFAICEELRSVYLLQSDYETKSSAIANAEKAICSELAISYLNHAEISLWPIGDDVNVEELAELAARDAVTGDDGVEDGYALYNGYITISKPDTRSIVRELANAYKLPISKIQRLYDYYSAAMATYDTRYLNEQFSAFVTRLQTVY